jgi:hypothetical protein
MTSILNPAVRPAPMTIPCLVRCSRPGHGGYAIAAFGQMAGTTAPPLAW